MPTPQEVAQYIYSRAPQYGVNPNIALGIAQQESGLRDLPSHWDVNGPSWGVFQLHSNPQGNAVGDQLGSGYGPGTSWQGQVDATLKYMGSNGYHDWSTYQNSGATGISNIGAGVAQKYDLASGSGISDQTAADHAQDYQQDYGSAPSDQGVVTDTYGGETYTHAVPGGPQSAQGYGQTDQGTAGSSPLPGPLGQLGIGGKGSGNFGLSGPQGQAGKDIGAGGLGKGGFGFGAGGSDSGGQDSSAGVQVDITDPHGIASQAGKSAEEGLKAGAKSIDQSTEGFKADTKLATDTANKDTQQITSEATGAVQYGGNLIYDTLPRFVGGFVAVVLIGAGLWMVGKRT